MNVHPGASVEGPWRSRSTRGVFVTTVVVLVLFAGSSLTFTVLGDAPLWQRLIGVVACVVFPGLFVRWAARLVQVTADERGLRLQRPGFARELRWSDVEFAEIGMGQVNGHPGCLLVTRDGQRHPFVVDDLAQWERLEALWARATGDPGGAAGRARLGAPSTTGGAGAMRPGSSRFSTNHPLVACAFVAALVGAYHLAEATGICGQGLVAAVAVLTATNVARRSRHGWLVLLPFAVSMAVAPSWLPPVGAIVVTLGFLRGRAQRRIMEWMQSGPAAGTEPPASPAPSPMPSATALAPAAEDVAASAAPVGETASAPAAPAASRSPLPRDPVDALPPAPLRELDGEDRITLSPAGRRVEASTEAAVGASTRVMVLQALILVAAHPLSWIVATVTGTTPSWAALLAGLYVPAILVLFLAGTWVLDGVLMVLGRANPARRRAHVLGKRRALRFAVLALSGMALIGSGAGACVTSTSRSGVAAPGGRDSPSAASVFLLALGGSWLVRDRHRRRTRERVRATPPRRLLLLRVFRPGPDHERRIARLLSILRWRWGLLGTTQMLGGPDFFGGDLGLGLSEWGLRRHLARSTADVDARIAAFRDDPAWPLVTGDPIHPVNALLCDGGVWQYAFQDMLAQADVVLMDLRGFSADNRGCVWELSRLICAVPSDRYLLLVDAMMDRAYLDAALARAWADRAAAPPEEDGDDPRVTIYTMRDGGPTLDAADLRAASAVTEQSGDGVAQSIRRRRAARQQAMRQSRGLVRLLYEAVAAAQGDREFDRRRDPGSAATVPAESELELADPALRARAVLADLVAIAAASMVAMGGALGLQSLLSKITGRDYPLIALPMLVSMAAVPLYEPLMMRFRGATLGHRMFGLRIVDLASGRPPTFWSACVRCWLKCLLSPLAALMARFGTKVLLHDRLTSSRCIVWRPAVDRGRRDAAGTPAKLPPPSG